MLNIRRQYLRFKLKPSFCYRLLRIRCNYFSAFIYVLILASVISYHQPFGLLHTFRHIIVGSDVNRELLQSLVEQHKEQQKVAFDWLKNVSSHLSDYPQLISTSTNQSRFYDYLQWKENLDPSNNLLVRPPHRHSISNTTDHILISILYGRNETNHHEGKFYIGQVLHRLLKTPHRRFIVTLCENENTNAPIPEGIEVIRRLLPVFLINTTSDSTINPFEREKQAHVQCISANFQAFPHVKYFLLLQDDAEPTSDDFYFRLSSFIDHRIEPRWSSNDLHRPHPGFVKIYHPRWLIDYFHPSIYIITQLFATSLLLAFIASTCLNSYQKRNDDKVKTMKRRRNYESVTFFTLFEDLNDFIERFRFLWNFFYCFILIILVLLLLNHTNVSWRWRSLHPAFYALYPSPSCCLPGVLFFRSTYQQVLHHLQSTRCTRSYAIDMALDDIPRCTGLKTFLMEPNLVHHIGLYSRLRHAYISPFLLD